MARAFLLIAAGFVALRSCWVLPAAPRNRVARCAVDPGDCKAVRSNAVNGVQLPTMDEET